MLVPKYEKCAHVLSDKDFDEKIDTTLKSVR